MFNNSRLLLLTLLLARTTLQTSIFARNELLDATEELSFPGFTCGFYNSKSLKAFNLFGLQTKTDQVVSIPNYKPNEIAPEVEATAYFNVCTSAQRPAECTGLKGFAYIVYGKEHKVCDTISSVGNTNKVSWKYKINFEGEKVKKSSQVTSIDIASEDERKGETNIKYVFKCKRKSQEEKKEVIIPKKNKKEDFNLAAPTTATWNNSQRRLEIFIETEDACGTDLGGFADFLEKYKVLPLLMMLLSLPITFFGLQFLKKTLAVLGFILTAASCTLLVSIITNILVWKLAQYLVFGIIVISLSLVIGYLFYHFTYVAVYVIGAFLGYIVARIGFTILEASVNKSFQIWIFYVFAMFLAAIGVALAHYLHDHIIIVSTSLGGGYLFVFAAGTALGNYPNLDRLKKNDQDIPKEEMTWMWVYFSINLVLFLLGMSYQYRQRFLRKKEEKKEIGSDYSVL